MQCLLGKVRLGTSSVQWFGQVWLYNPTDCSMPGFSVHHHLPEFTQTHVCWVDDAIQSSHPVSSPSSPAFNHSQHQGLFKWVSSWGCLICLTAKWVPIAQLGSGSLLLSTHASSCTAWTSSQHGTWVPRVNIPREPGRSLMAFSFLTIPQKSLNMTSAISYFKKGAQTHSDSREEDLVSLGWWSSGEESVEDCVPGRHSLPLSLENVICQHTSEMDISPASKRVMNFLYGQKPMESLTGF